MRRVLRGVGVRSTRYRLPYTVLGPQSSVFSPQSSVGSRFEAVGELKAENGIPRTVDRGQWTEDRRPLLQSRRRQEIREILLDARQHHERAGGR